jgi:hypothetical protein
MTPVNAEKQRISGLLKKAAVAAGLQATLGAKFQPHESVSLWREIPTGFRDIHEPNKWFKPDLVLTSGLAKYPIVLHKANEAFTRVGWCLECAVLGAAQNQWFGISLVELPGVRDAAGDAVRTARQDAFRAKHPNTSDDNECIRTWVQKLFPASPPHAGVNWNAVHEFDWGASGEQASILAVVDAASRAIKSGKLLG